MFDDPKLDGHKVSLELLKHNIYAKETHKTTIRIAPSLTINAVQIDQIAEAINSVIAGL
jgi:acetylornithine/succinyldiaminopimelate/putrescine aminotransferase